MIERTIAYTLFLVIGFLSGCGTTPEAHFQKVEKISLTTPAEEALNYIIESDNPLRLEIKER